MNPPAICYTKLKQAIVILLNFGLFFKFGGFIYQQNSHYLRQAFPNIDKSLVKFVFNLVVKLFFLYTLNLIFKCEPEKLNK